MQEDIKSTKPKRKNYTVAGLAIGIGVGVAIGSGVGAATGDIGTWTVVGIGSRGGHWTTGGCLPHQKTQFSASLISFKSSLSCFQTKRLYLCPDHERYFSSKLY